MVSKYLIKIFLIDWDLNKFRRNRKHEYFVYGEKVDKERIENEIYHSGTNEKNLIKLIHENDKYFKDIPKSKIIFLK